MIMHLIYILIMNDEDYCNSPAIWFIFIHLPSDSCILSRLAYWKENVFMREIVERSETLNSLLEVAGLYNYTDNV